MISDLSKLTEAIDAVTDRASAVDLAGLEHQVKTLTPQQREAVRRALTERGRATVALNGKSITLQLRDRTERRA